MINIAQVEQVHSDNANVVRLFELASEVYGEAFFKTRSGRSLG